MRSLQLMLTALAAFAVVAAAAPDTPHVQLFARDIYPRQTAAAGSKAAAAASTTPAGQGMRVLPTAGSGDAVVGDSTPTEEPQASGTGKDGKASTPKKSVLRIPNTAIAGAVAMKTPSVYEANILYKIGTTVTLEWNYTHLIVTPAAINIVAFCKDAARDFTIAGNVSGGVTRILWDTEAQYKTDIFPVASYTLNIFDASHEKGNVASGGYLSGFQGLTFGMYTPEPYISIADGYKCGSCDSAAARLEMMTVSMVLGMGLVAATSFMWFIGGMGLY